MTKYPCEKCKDNECTGACMGMECPVFLYPWLYDMAEKEGHDLRGYAKLKPIPATPTANEPHEA